MRTFFARRSDEVDSGSDTRAQSDATGTEWLGYLLYFVCAAACAANPTPADGVKIAVASSTLRSMATVVVMPLYPPGSVARGTVGPSVIDIYYDAAGTIVSATVLQAPDSLIAKAVEKAVSQWHFRPAILSGGTTAGQVEGRLVFYFRLTNGKPTVIDANALELERELKRGGR